MSSRTVLCVFLFLIILPFSSSLNLVEVGYDNPGLYGVRPELPVFDNNTAFVNMSQYWNTVTLGPMDDASATQFNNIDGTLTVDVTHFDLRWCELAGCTMSGDINMDGNNIINARTINVTEQINIVSTISDPQVTVSNTNPFGVSEISVINSVGGRTAFAKLGPNIPSVISNGYKFGGNSSGLVSFQENESLVFLTNDGDIIFGTAPDGDTALANFTVGIDTELGALTFIGSKWIRPAIFEDGASLLFQSTDTMPAGQFPFIFVAQDANDDTIITSWDQNGKNNSFSGVMNSFVPVPKSWITFVGNITDDESGIAFLTNRSSYINYCDYLQTNLSLIPEGCKYFADTTSQGVPLVGAGNLEVHKSAVIHGGLLVYDDFDYVTRDDNDFDIEGGDGHIRKTQTILSNVTFINQFICDFNTDICAFENTGTPVDPVNQWNSKSSVLCPASAPSDEDCAGSAGSLRVMEFSEGTQFSNYTNITFWYTTAFSGVGSEMSVTLDDNLGNTTTVFSQTVGVSDQFTSFVMPPTYLNKSNVTMSFICDAKNNLNGCYVDDVRVFATFSDPILINATEQQGKWIFGESGQLDECSVNVFYEIIENSTQVQKIMEIGCIDTLTRFLGNTSFVDSTVVNQTVVGDSHITGDLTVDGTISEGGELLEDKYFLVNGSSTMQANANIGGFGVSNVSTIDGGGSEITVGDSVDLDSHDLSFAKSGEAGILFGFGSTGGSIKQSSAGTGRILDIINHNKVRLGNGFNSVSYDSLQNGSFYPEQSGTVLGRSSVPWDTLYVDTVDLGADTITDATWSCSGIITAEDLQINSNAIIDETITVGAETDTTTAIPLNIVKTYTPTTSNQNIKGETVYVTSASAGGFGTSSTIGIETTAENSGALSSGGSVIVGFDSIGEYSGAFTGSGSAKSYGGFFEGIFSGSGQGATTSSETYGILGTTTSNVGTIGNHQKWGGRFTVTGTADTNYGIYASAVGATSNWAGYFVEDVYVGGNLSTNTLSIGSNVNSGLSSGDINASTIYYDTLTAKSPMIMCSDDWCSVSFPKHQKTLWLQKDENWTILDIVYEGTHYTKQTFFSLIEGTNYEDIALRLNDKIKKLQDKIQADLLEEEAKLLERQIREACIYSWDGECFEIVRTDTVYEGAVEVIQIESMTTIIQNITKLNSITLMVETIEQSVQVWTGEMINEYQFKEDCNWDGNYYCKVRESR